MNIRPSHIKIIIGLSIIVGIVALVQVTRMISTSPSAKTVEVSIRIPQNSWRWDPKEIIIPANTAARLRIYNEDIYEHGIFIKALNIKQTIVPQAETVINIPATPAGEYPFRCSVWCGEGHAEQNGVLIVR